MIQRIHNTISSAHIYRTKEETAFKLVCLLFCASSIYFAILQGENIAISTLGISLFVYSISLFMEFTMRLVKKGGVAALPLMLHFIVALAVLYDSVCCMAYPEGRIFGDYITLLVWLPFIMLSFDWILISFNKERIICVEDNLF